MPKKSDTAKTDAPQSAAAMTGNAAQTGNAATGIDRRRFLGNGMALGLGAGTLLADLGLSRPAAAQNATPAPAARHHPRGARPCLLNRRFRSLHH